jgi:hypothetical protein
MNPERWERLKPLFHEALEQDAGFRTEFLRAACVGDGYATPNPRISWNRRPCKSKPWNWPGTSTERYGALPIGMGSGRIMRPAPARTSGRSGRLDSRLICTEDKFGETQTGRRGSSWPWGPPARHIAGSAA